MIFHLFSTFIVCNFLCLTSLYLILASLAEFITQVCPDLSFHFNKHFLKVYCSPDFLLDPGDNMINKIHNVLTPLESWWEIITLIKVKLELEECFKWCSKYLYQGELSSQGCQDNYPGDKTNMLRSNKVRK